MSMLLLLYPSKCTKSGWKTLVSTSLSWNLDQEVILPSPVTPLHVATLGDPGFLWYINLKLGIFTFLLLKIESKWHSIILFKLQPTSTPN